MVRRPGLVIFALLAVWGLVALRIVAEVRRANDPLRYHDFRTLANDQRLFFEGVYPHAAVEPVRARGAYSVYPPYAFINAMPWIPPGLAGTTARAWFTSCQLGAMAVLLGFAWRTGRNVDVRLGWLLTGGIAAMTGLWADFLFGNFSALACAPLVALFVAEQTSSPLAAGVAWWAAMLKPQIGTMFSALFLRDRRWTALALGGALLLVATGLVCAWTGVAPGRTVSAVYLRALFALSVDGHSLVTVTNFAGIPGHAAQPVLAVVGFMLLVMILNTRLREADVLARFAFVALVARLCLYHRPCDDLLLVFAIVYFGRRAWQTNVAADWIAAAALGMSVWLPTRWMDPPILKTSVVVVWLVLASKLFHDARVRGTPAAESPV